MAGYMKNPLMTSVSIAVRGVLQVASAADVSQIADEAEVDPKKPPIKTVRTYALSILRVHG